MNHGGTMKKKEKIKTDENILYLIGWILLLLVVLLAAAVKLLPGFSLMSLPPCLFHLLTGFYCPGCGGTRALLALGKGKVFASLLLHPFVLYTVLVGGWFMISHTIERLSRGKLAIGMKYRDGWLWGALALTGVNFIIKNALLLAGTDLLELAGHI